MPRISRLVAAVALLLFGALGARAETALEILGAPANANSLDASVEVAVDDTGNMYVARYQRDNAFKITPAGVVSQIIDASGSGAAPLARPRGIAVDGAGNVYVAGFGSHNVFKITPSGSITEILDSTGDGTNPLSSPGAIAVDNADNLYVTGRASDNVFRVTPAGVVTQIIGATGDGINVLDVPAYVVVDSLGNAYVSASRNVFKITAGGSITEVWSTNASIPDHRLAVDGADNVYVNTGSPSEGLFVLKITPSGAVTPIVDGTGDGINDIYLVQGIGADPTGNVYVGFVYRTGSSTSSLRWNILRVAPDGSMSRLFEKRTEPEDLLVRTVDGSGNVYFSTGTGQVFAITAKPVFGHTFSFTRYSGDPLVGRLYRLLMKFRQNGNITPFSLPGDPVANGGSVTVTRDGGMLFDPLTAGTWEGLGNPPGAKGWRYRNLDAPAGGEVSVLLIKQKAVSVLAAGTGTMPPPSGASGSITALISVDDQTYCAHATAPHAKEVTDLLIKSQDQWANLACSPSGAFISVEPSVF
jgi:hypothetical protein